jgi:hypothetical protein
MTAGVLQKNWRIRPLHCASCRNIIRFGRKKGKAMFDGNRYLACAGFIGARISVSHSMQALRKPFMPGETRSRRLLGLACLALILALELFASFPTLHRLVHADADCFDHQCVVTLFKQGNVCTADTAPVIVAFVAIFLFYLPVLSSAVSSLFDYRFSHSRGPPTV